MDFIQAKNFTRATKPRTITLLVVHTPECAERSGAARSIARYFADQPKNGALDEKWCRKDKAGNLIPWAGASAHEVIDSAEVVQCVRDEDIAWHAGPVNGYSVGFEFAGRAGQTIAEWNDDYSLATLTRGAQRMALRCHEHGIPVVRRSAAELAAGERYGICGHGDVTIGLKSGTHWDPGPNFPWATFLGMVSDELARIEASEAPTLPDLSAVPPDELPTVPELPVREDDGGASRHRATMDVVAEMARGRYRGE